MTTDLPGSLTHAEGVDPLAALGDSLRLVPWAALVPLRNWWATGAWRRGWAGLFALFALAPFVLLQATSRDSDIKRLAWGFAIYFAAWWLVALWALIRPGTLDIRMLAKIAVFTSAAGTAIAIFLEKRLQPDSHSFVQMVIGVGVPEELAKALGVFLFVYVARRSVGTRAYLFAGVVSGLAFGAAEAVSYSERYADLAPYLNASSYTAITVWRLLSDSLIHATLAAVVAYFLGLAAQYPRSRIALITTGLLLGAVLHGAYDRFASSGWFGPAMAAVIVFVFVGYVESGDRISTQIATHQARSLR